MFDVSFWYKWPVSTSRWVSYRSMSACRGLAQSLESTCTHWCPHSCHGSPRRRCHKNLWKMKSTLHEGRGPEDTLIHEKASWVQSWGIGSWTTLRVLIIQGLCNPMERDTAQGHLSFRSMVPDFRCTGDSLCESKTSSNMSCGLSKCYALLSYVLPFFKCVQILMGLIIQKFI